MSLYEQSSSIRAALLAQDGERVGCDPRGVKSRRRVRATGCGESALFSQSYP